MNRYLSLGPCLCGLVVWTACKASRPPPSSSTSRLQTAGAGDSGVNITVDSGEDQASGTSDAAFNAIERVPDDVSGQMLHVPRGSRKGKHDVVEGFLLDETEVTFGAYKACVLGGGCEPPHGGPVGCARGVDDFDPLQPVHCVSVGEAEAFCAWATKRLPTAEEWLYAMSGADGRAYPWGNTPDIERVCSYKVLKIDWISPSKAKIHDGGCKAGTHPSGKGPFGHQDMLANVAEWTATEKNGKRLVLGSSFGTVSGVMDWREYWTGMMAEFRQNLAPNTKQTTVGFRCARTYPSEAQPRSDAGAGGE